MNAQTVSPTVAERIDRPARGGGAPTSGSLSGIWVCTIPGRIVGPAGAGTFEEAPALPKENAGRRRDQSTAVALRRIGALLLNRSNGGEFESKPDLEGAPERNTGRAQRGVCGQTGAGMACRLGETSCAGKLRHPLRD